MTIPFAAALLTGLLLLPDGATPAAPTATATPSAATATAAAPKPAPAPLKDEDVICLVNGEPITKAAYKELVFQQYSTDFLDLAINEKLLRHRAKELGVTTTDKDLEGWVEDKVKQALDMPDTRGMMQEDELRSRLRRGAAVGYLIEKLVKMDRVDDAGLKREYDLQYGERRKARHILILPEGADGSSEPLPEDLEKAKKKAMDVWKQLKDGADFAVMAKKESQDPGSKDSGGELPEFGKGDVVPEFADVAFALKENEISEPVKSQYGYHVIQVTKIVPPAKPFDDEIKKELRAEAEKRPIDRTEYQRYIDDLRKSAKIERKIP